MEWKIILKYYLPALVGFLIYFAGALSTGHVFDGSGNIHIGRLIFHCFVLLLSFIGVTIGVSVELTRFKRGPETEATSTEKNPQETTHVQQIMKESPGGSQVVNINKTENPIHKPIVRGIANVEVTIESDDDFDGVVINIGAYLAFVKDSKALLKTSSIGYRASQIGDSRVVYKGNFEMDGNDPAVGHAVSFLKETEYIQVEFGRMPSNSKVLGGHAICLVNDSIRFEFSIPAQKTQDRCIFIHNVEDTLKILNEPNL